MDVGSDLGQHGRVLPVVMRAKQQVLVAVEQHPDVSLSAAAIAAVHGVYRSVEEQSSAEHRFLALSPASGP
jgi:hypothetical protein